AGVPGGDMRGAMPSAASDSRLMSSGLPALEENDEYGEPLSAVGPSGRICQTCCWVSPRKSTNARAVAPRSPIPHGPGKELGWSSTPLRLAIFDLTSSPDEQRATTIWGRLKRVKTGSSSSGVTHRISVPSCFVFPLTV